MCSFHLRGFDVLWKCKTKNIQIQLRMIYYCCCFRILSPHHMANESKQSYTPFVGSYSASADTKRKRKWSILGTHTKLNRLFQRHHFNQPANMATELTVQSERAFQKQPHIFVNQKSKRTKSTRVGKGGRRWYKDVGLGFRTPKTAIEGSYIGMQPFFFGIAGTIS